MSTCSRCLFKDASLGGYSLPAVVEETCCAWKFVLLRGCVVLRVSRRRHEYTKFLLKGGCDGPRLAQVNNLSSKSALVCVIGTYLVR